jgi:hypothetical protein
VSAFVVRRWYGFTSNINETLFREVGDGLVSSGLAAAGWKTVWISDGWAIGRDNKTGHVIEDPAVFPSGMKHLTDYLHGRGLSVGIYTSVGTLTCLGYAASQPKRPGSCGFEQNDANVYVHEWGIDAIFDDGCGPCPQHDPYVAMRDALNKTGQPVWYAIHAGTAPGSPNATVANMWRTGPDLSSSTFAMWTSRLDTSTSPSQNTLAGPGSFRDPDKLEVGYSPRAPKGSPRVMTAREQRAMYTMWAALPAPLILSADLRASTSGIDAEALATLTNPEVIATNQDPGGQPMKLVSNTSAHGLQVWRKPLSDGAIAVVFFHRGVSTEGPLPSSVPAQEMQVRFETLGYRPGAQVEVRDMWARKSLGASFNESFSARVAVREARIYKFTPRPSPIPPPYPPDVLPLTLFEPSTGAMCLDGSMGGYHARNGSKTQLMISLPVRRGHGLHRQSDRPDTISLSVGVYVWVALFAPPSHSFSICQGGGWCWDAGTCAARSKTSLGSMTAFIKSNGMTRAIGEGELSALPALNPHFHGFSAISPVYCDGSNFAGSMDHPNVTVPGGGQPITLHVRGRAILKATLDVALEQWGLKHTLREVMLTGCSAGGTATYYNVDFVQRYILSRLTHSLPLKTRAFGNAGWFLDTNSKTWNGDGWDAVPGIQRMADKALFNYAGLAPILSPLCQASYAPLGESWKCAMSQYLYPFIEQPTLVLQSSYDLNQLVTGGPPCVHASTFSRGQPVHPFPHSLNNCSANEVEVVNRYGDALNASLFIARRGAVFAPTCTIHCYTSHWTRIAIDGMSMANAIGQFFAASDPSGMLWYDKCRGGNCNPTCPIYPQNSQ